MVRLLLNPAAFAASVFALLGLLALVPANPDMQRADIHVDNGFGFLDRALSVFAIGKTASSNGKHANDCGNDGYSHHVSPLQLVLGTCLAIHKIGSAFHWLVLGRQLPVYSQARFLQLLAAGKISSV